MKRRQEEEQRRLLEEHRRQRAGEIKLELEQIGIDSREQEEEEFKDFLNAAARNDEVLYPADDREKEEDPASLHGKTDNNVS